MSTSPTPSSTILLARQCFDGKNWQQNVLLKRHATGAYSLSPLEDHAPLPDRVVAYLVPALMDLQIYGAGGRLLSVAPEAATIEAIAHYCRAGGAAWFQPTVATHTKEVFFAAIDAVRDYRNKGGKGCLGLHLEGPWIHPEKRGAHALELVHAPSAAEVAEVLAYGAGVVSMITLAPEVVDPRLVDSIQAAGIVVSAGHSQASYAAATAAFDRGIPTATHLFNAMSALQHRAPGMVGAVLDHPKVLSSIVPDGYHVDWAAIRIAHKIMGPRLFAITDAVTETDQGPYPHVLVHDRYESKGILSGSALTMLKALHNLHYQVGIPLTDALRMCSTVPAQLVPPPAPAYLALDEALEGPELFY